MIEFVLNNKKIVTHAHSGENLLQFIREHEHLKGTKVGCREGDCGACTVLVGTLNQNGQVEYKTVVSCLSSLAAVAGKHVVTVEGLNLDSKLNKAQQAIHDNLATQCGFCTPGFIVSMTALTFEEDRKNQDPMHAIGGNICRCTGYKSIEKAVNQFSNVLEEDQKPLEWYIQNNFIPCYFAEVPQLLKMLTVSEIAGGSPMVAGGTDLYVKEADTLADRQIHYLEGNQNIEIQQGFVILGGGVNISQLWHHRELNEIFPRWASYLKLISSKPIQNMATIAGNFVNASPIGDLSILFLALDATLTLKKDEQNIRQIALKDFFQDYKKVDLQKDEWIESLRFKKPQQFDFFNFEKVSKRTHLDIASVNTAISIQVEDNEIQDVHLSIGGVSAIPKFLFETANCLKNKKLTSNTLKEAVAILQTEISPIDDLRGSAAYKRMLAQQLFFAHFISLFPERIQLNDLI